MDEYTCPSCESDLRGEPIPEKHRHNYGSSTHFSRKIGLYDRGKDRVTHWSCPDCGHTWERE